MANSYIKNFFHTVNSLVDIPIWNQMYGHTIFYIKKLSAAEKYQKEHLVKTTVQAMNFKILWRLICSLTIFDHFLVIFIAPRLF